METNTLTEINFDLQFDQVRKASRSLAIMEEGKIKELLHSLADLTGQEMAYILKENKKDLDMMDKADSKYDRLLLNEERIKSIASDIRNVANLPDPVGRVLMEKEVDNGLRIKKTAVPLGVVGIIYEARPNVTWDVFSLCMRSRNACVLKGGSDAEHSNIAIVSLIKRVLEKSGFNSNLVYLMPADRNTTTLMLEAVGKIDILIPRGGRGLIDFVRDNAKIPVIETGAGICHTYVDKDADKEKAVNIVFNSKTRRVSVCNALDCLVVHSDRVGDLPAMGQKLKEKEVTIFADERAYNELKDSYPASLLHLAQEEHFGTEFLDYKMAIKTVNSFEEAMHYVQEKTSGHSEAIVTENQDLADKYLMAIDAAAVYHNTSTAFTDGAQFGLGAEIGISTQKLHARGPMALEELCTYKWIVSSQGLTRP